MLGLQLNTTTPSYSKVLFFHFKKEKLNVLNSSGIDATGFKRVSVFKLSDFNDLEKAMNFWFEHYDKLLNAQKAYDRILLDEELKIATAGKFLAAMQLVEGYAQAFADEEQEIKIFLPVRLDFITIPQN